MLKDAPVTLINAPWHLVLSTFNSTPPLYALQILHDMQVALTSDLYITIISYSLYHTLLSKTSTTTTYLKSIGLSTTQITEIQKDNEYGWASYTSSKIWVQAYFDYITYGNLDNGGYDVIRNYFQIQALQEVITPGGLIYNQMNVILKDMLTRYGSTNATVLGCLQWSNATLTLNPPMGLLPIVTPLFPLPSYKSLNSTLSMIPEMKWFLELTKSPALDFSSSAQKLLQVVYTYPNYNYQSIINIDNIKVLAQFVLARNITGIVEQ